MATNSYSMGAYFDDSIAIPNRIAEETKKECLWEYDNFRQPATVDNLQGIATMVHSLLFLEPGTYPDCPSMGIGIQNYQFDLLTEDLMSNLRNKIYEQLALYMPTIYIKNIIIKKFENDSLRKVLGIGFEIGTISYKQSTEDAEKQFFLAIQEQPDSRKLLTRIIY